MEKIYDDDTKWIMHELRRIHTKWPPRKLAYTSARVSRGQYTCAHCKNIFRPKEIDLDHIDPVINPQTGFVDWNTYITRLFIPQNGYQVLCKRCHKTKTHDTENVVRDEYERLQKSNEQELGTIYNNLQIIDFAGLSKAGYLKVLCDCSCGNSVVVQLNNVKSGHTKSCGCIRETHKLSGSKIYKTWCNINSRCNNPNATGYKYYGGKGIEVEWCDFESFYNDMGDVPDGMTIERVDSNSNYSKTNCVWATPKQQARNVSSNHLLTYDGETKCVSEWATLLDIKPNTLLYRIRRGWTVERALGF